MAKTRYKVRKSLLLIGILCTGLLSGFIGLVAYFGQYMGTFVIALDDQTATIGISLSESIDGVQQTRLQVNPVISADPVTFKQLAFEQAINTDGDLDRSNEHEYIAYTFYLHNAGRMAVNAKLNLKQVAIRGGVDSAVRICILEDPVVQENGMIDFRTGKYYLKHEKNEDEILVNDLGDYAYLYNKLTKTYYYETVSGEYVIENFRPLDCHKYTMLIWLEGWDNDCMDDIKKGQLKMEITFSILGIIEENKTGEN